MFSRMTTRVILHSVKRRLFIGSVPTKFRTIFCGTPKQQNYDSKPIASPTIPPTFQSDNKKYWEEHFQRLSEQQNKLTAKVDDLQSQLDTRLTQLCALLTRPSEQDARKKINNASPPKPHVEDFAGHIRKIFLQFPRERFGDLDSLIRSGSSQDLFSDDNHVEANIGVSPTLLKLMRDVVSELVLFHKWGIAHGSLNPQNILLLKRERLFAKLADPGFSRGILDWETPEQLLGGRQSAAGDMFNFGCVLFFCLSTGGHPFGETSDERHQNIKENKMELSRVNCFPEVSRLLSKLLNPDPEMRLTAIEVLNHPLFWSSKKRLEFIEEFNQFISIKGRDNPNLRKEMENIMPIATGEKSSEDVGYTNVPQGFDDVLGLLDCIGGLVDGYNYIEQLKMTYGPYYDSVKPLYRRLDDYLRQVPWLFIHLYEVAHKHCENEFWLSNYCHKQHPNAVTRSG